MGRRLIEILTRLASFLMIACVVVGCRPCDGVDSDPSLSALGFIPGVEYRLTLEPFLGDPRGRSVLFYGSGRAFLSGPVELATYNVGVASIGIQVGLNQVTLDPIGLGRYQGRGAQYTLWTLHSW